MAVGGWLFWVVFVLQCNIVLFEHDNYCIVTWTLAIMKKHRQLLLGLQQRRQQDPVLRGQIHR